MISAIRLPGALQRYLNGTVDALLSGESGRYGDFALPAREEALLPADSLSWRVLKNPIALFVGGTAAVILELAEPAVRAGVWEHSSFRKDPLNRLKRTGLAAMISVYGARSVAEPMIARVVRMHASVQGTTTAGIAYSANDPRLLTWVHATAAFGFAEAYHRYVQPLSTENLNDFYREGAPVSRLYGAIDAPRSIAEMRALFESTRSTLAPSPIIFEFLRIMRETAAFPRPLRWLQPAAAARGGGIDPRVAARNLKPVRILRTAQIRAPAGRNGLARVRTGSFCRPALPCNPVCASDCR